jgi:outer membrane immunogenic protein
MLFRRKGVKPPEGQMLRQQHAGLDAVSSPHARDAIAFNNKPPQKHSRCLQLALSRQSRQRNKLVAIGLTADIGRRRRRTARLRMTQSGQNKYQRPLLVLALVVQKLIAFSAGPRQATRRPMRVPRADRTQGVTVSMIGALQKSGVAFAAAIILAALCGLSAGAAAQTNSDVDLASHRALEQENKLLRKRIAELETLAGVPAAKAQAQAVTSGMPTKVAPAPTDRVNWTGFYAGGHAGYGVTHIIPPQIADLFGPAQPDGGFWGGQIGFNYQATQTWVIGAELDGAVARMEKTLIGPEPLRPQTLLATTTKVEALASARARIGMRLDRTLLYATGGPAWGRFDLVTSSSNSNPGPGNPQVGESRRTLAGWTAGAGLEAQLWSNWTGKIEYLYYRFPPASFTNFNGATTPPSGGENIHTVRLGMNWLFQ